MMKYTVTYKSISEIMTTYYVEKVPDDEGLIYECILLEGTHHVARFIKMNMPNTFLNQQPLLQQIIRCYIINSNDVPFGLTISQIFDRYG